MNWKCHLLLPALSSLIALPGALQAQTVSTDPVGVISTELPANAFTYFGMSLTTPPVLSSSSATLVSNNQLDFGVALASLDVNTAYCIQILGGTYEGYSADIASWSGQILTLSEDVGLVIGAEHFANNRIAIHPLPTLSSVFGAENSAGLKAGTIGSADLIYLYIEGEFKRFYYSSSAFGQTPGWRDQNGDDATGVTFHYGDGIVIQNKDNAPKTIITGGNVKLGPTNVPIYEGFNLVANPSSIVDKLTLGNSNLEIGLKHGTQGSADIIYIPNSEGGFDKYYYSSSAFGQTPGWKAVGTGDDASGVLLPNSGSFFIDRKNGQGETSVTILGDLPNP